MKHHFSLLQFAIAGLAVANIASAEQQQANKSPNDIASVTVLVDGAIHPELIPDDVAFMHFLKALAKNPLNEDQALEERRRHAYVSHFFRAACSGQDRDLTLNSEQIRKLFALVDDVVPNVDQANARAAASSTAADRQAAKQALQQLLLQSLAMIAESVDPDADAKIRFHISDHVKGRIKLMSAQMSMP